MKYSPEQLSVMAHTVIHYYPIYYSRSLTANAVRSQTVVSMLQARFGCSETYVLNQLTQMAGQFSPTHSTNRA